MKRQISKGFWQSDGARLLLILLVAAGLSGAQEPVLPVPETPTDAAEPDEALPPAATLAPATDQLISLNFRDAPLDQVLNFYSELTSRTIIKAPGLNATITLRGQTRLTPAECLQAIESVLAINNIALVPLGDKFLKVVQTAAARGEALPIVREVPEGPLPATDGLISQVVPLKYIETTEALAVLQGLIHAYGRLQPLERTNSLLITDTSINIQRMLEILDVLDQPIEAKVETRVYELKYAEASAVAARLNELIQETQADAARPRVVAVAAPPGVIRPPTPAQGAVTIRAEEALAERGVIQGKVKIVADERTNVLIVMSRPSNFAFFDKIITVLDREIEPEVLAKVLPLQFAKAEDIGQILNDFIGAARAESGSTTRAPVAQPTTPTATAAAARSQALQEYAARRAAMERAQGALADEKARIGQLSSSTKILPDKRTNSLLIMGTRGDVAALEEIIQQLDIMLAQVLIEAVIIEVGLNNKIEYGIDWLQRSMSVYDTRTKGGLPVRNPVMSFAGGWGGEGGTFLDAGAVQNDIQLSPGRLTYFAKFIDLNLDVVLRMAAASSNARILSTPVVLTTDNTEAKITVAEQRPIVTSSSAYDTGRQISTYEYKNIGIELTVTPRINPRGMVVMEISQSADNVGENVRIDNNEVPTILKREIKAQVAVENRSTLVLGGLVSTDHARSVSKVPILGDIPLLGQLFRTTSKGDRRRELLVFLTPYVLVSPEEARSESRRLLEGTQLKGTAWPKGWSDSEMAIPTREQIRKQKKAEREAARRQRAASKAEKAMPPEPSPPPAAEALPRSLVDEAVPP